MKTSGSQKGQVRLNRASMGHEFRQPSAEVISLTGFPVCYVAMVWYWKILLCVPPILVKYQINALYKLIILFLLVVSANKCFAGIKKVFFLKRIGFGAMLMVLLAKPTIFF